jgi:hypothetical protein
VRSSVNPDLKYSGKGSDVFEVKTPNAVAGVRGTIFTTRFSDQTMKTEVGTERGLVFVSSPGNSSRGVLVPKGQFSALAGNGAGVRPSSPRPLSENANLSKSISELSGARGSSEDSGSKSSGDNSGKSDSAATSTSNKTEGGSTQANAGEGKASPDGTKAAAEGSPSAASGGGTASMDAPLSREPVAQDSGAGAGRSPAGVEAPVGADVKMPTLMGESSTGSTSNMPLMPTAPKIPMGQLPPSVKDAVQAKANDTILQRTSGRVVIKLPK